MDVFYNFLKGKIGFFISFIISKGTVFIAPLLVAELLSKDDFGTLEYALAGLGILLNTFVNMGVPAAYPYFKLKQKNSQINNVFNLHYIWLLFFFICTQVVYVLFDFSLHYYIALNVAYIISNQIYISIQLKTNENISLAVFIDSGVYIALLVFYVLVYTGVINAEIKLFSYIIFGYALLYATYALSKIKVLKNKNLFKSYRTVLTYSIHVLIGGLLIYFITVSGRILIEFFINDFEKVGVYAYYFRLSAVVVMLYQVINIVFFKKMYTLDPEKLDGYFAFCFIALYTISIIVFLCTPVFLWDFSTYFSSTITEYKTMYFLLSSQMVFWIATALLSNIIDREKLASKNNPLFIVLLIVFIVVLYVFKEVLSLDLFTFIHMIIILCAAIIQIYTLAKKKIYFKKSVVSLLFIATASVFVYLIILE